MKTTQMYRAPKAIQTYPTNYKVCQQTPGPSGHQLKDIVEVAGDTPEAAGE